MQTSKPLEKLGQYSLNTLEDVERHHTLSLAGLRHHIDGLETIQSDENMTTQIGILACMLQLDSFEVSSK
jgi:hypothetical protein